jgi:Terminase RNaseH-like domain
MNWRREVAGPTGRFYIGLDLGQRRDHSAMAVVERVSRPRPYGEPEFVEARVRHVERIPLGATYPEVVEHVAAVTRAPELQGRCEVVVDATGVGAPVVDLLRAARLECEVTAVKITGGEKENGRLSRGGGEFNVPKQDLFAAVQLLIEKGELRIARGLGELGALVEELVDVRRTTKANGRERMGADGHGEHDDLVIALALGCWKARRPRPIVGERNDRRVL